jgi:hypothetical protein
LQAGPEETERLADVAKPTFFNADDAVRQLRNVARHAISVGAGCVAVEAQYVDRDFAEEHSVYYSRSLQPYTGFCQRVHFFRGTQVEVTGEFDRLLRDGAALNPEEYRRTCREFSRARYVGFCVVRPLPGSPVGRTILRPPGEGDSGVVMEGIREYPAHLLGVELTARGLAFQQQDLGVSACATTAVWSSLQKMRDHEDIASFSPAAITTLASRYSLPFGRMMPAEGGLNLDQMCQAIQAVGASPNLIRVDSVREARLCLYSAIWSGHAPVIIARYGKDVWHAVTAAGMKLEGEAIVETGEERSHWRAESSRLKWLFIHDDRVGPYTGVKFGGSGPAGNDPQITYDPPDGPSWRVTHLIVPMHATIRLSFLGLKRAVSDALLKLTAFRTRQAEIRPGLAQIPLELTYDQSIIRSYAYIESLIREGPADCIDELCNLVMLPRYVGVASVKATDYLDRIDVLIDTTDTYRNVRALAVIPRGATHDTTAPAVEHLAKAYGCWAHHGP